MSRVSHKPTSETRAQVEALSGFGIRHDLISVSMGIDAKTLRKHYRPQLDMGHIKAYAAVARALHESATNGNVVAMIFWLKAQAKWRDRPDDVGNEGGEEAQPVAVTIGVVDGRLPDA